MPYKTFEELPVWQKSREFSLKIYRITSETTLADDFTLKNQMRKAAGAIMDNIAEGFERNGNRDLIHYLYIAKGSAGEVRSQLIRAYDLKYIPENQFMLLKEDSTAITRSLSKFIDYLARSPFEGAKFARKT